MTFISYSQNFEDVLLWRALKDIPNGCYLDIGAQDPVADSVSLAFYQAGWRGIHVEPTSAYAAKLRAARPDEIVVEAAVSDVPGLIEFFEIEHTGISTGRSDIAEHHATSGFEPRKILVPTVRLDSLLAASRDDVHWMKVDVEGMETSVLRSWGDSVVRPWLLVIESTFPGSQTPTQDEWIEEVLKRDYREVFYDGLSRFFLHHSQREREGAFKAAVNVFDGFAVAQHHFSASFMRSRLQDEEDRFRNELAHAVSLQDAAEKKAAAAIEDQQQARSELAATAAKEATLLARMLDSERDHAVAIDTLWRERQAAEAHLFAEFNARTGELQQALERGRLEADQERKREREQLELFRATEVAARMEHARADERAASLERELTRQVEAHEQFRREANETRQHEREELLAARGAEAVLRADHARLLQDLDRIQQDRRQENEEHQNSRAALERELEWHRASFIRADGLINDARRHSARAWDRIGLLLHLSGTGRVADALSAWSMGPRGHSRINTSEIESTNDHDYPDTVAQMKAGNPYLRANSLAELFAWDDVAFVRCAFVTVLGRQPDTEGEAYYTDRIRRGHSKMEILWQLRTSAEAARHDPGIAGFDRALRKSRWERGRMGWLIRFFTRGEGDSAALRRHRMLINELGRNETARAGASDVLIADFRNLAAQLGGLTEAVARLSAGPIISTDATPSDVKIRDNPDYRRLSSRGQKIFGEVHAHSN
jgi:FkbM family methyltransferase